jgi:hypothetical protein
MYFASVVDGGSGGWSWMLPTLPLWYRPLQATSVAFAGCWNR